MKKLAVVLFAVSLSAGAAHAKMMAHPHKHLPACGDGMVKASCVCKTASSKKGQLCKVGMWCHTFQGVCRP